LVSKNGNAIKILLTNFLYVFLIGFFSKNFLKKTS
jgi:hypothetical protein